MTALEQWQKEIMERGELFLVGGVVRDSLLGLETSGEDVDYLVRGIPPEELERILSRHGSVTYVGKVFGVYKFKPPHRTREIDIAYPRTEVSTGPGHREFAVDWDWRLSVEADLGRRDFTINAMAKSLSDGRIVDPHGGAGDIERRLLRMVFGDAFREDPLRILRGVRFAARFSLRIEERTYDAMKESAPLVDTLSAERVQEEFTRLLKQCERPSEGLEAMRSIGVLSRVLPELDRAYGVAQNEFHIDDVFWHSLRSCDEAPRDNLVVRWAALLHDLGKVDKKQVIVEEGSEKTVFYGHETLGAEIAGEVLRRLKYGNDFIARCVRLVETHMFLYRREWNRSTVRRFMHRVGDENLKDLFLLREADCRSRGKTDEVEELEDLKARVESERREARAFKISDLAIGGEDVKKALDVGEGPEVGRMLQALFEAVLDDPALNTRDALLRLLGEKFKE